MCRFVYPSCVKFGDREARAEPYRRDDNQYFLKTNRNFLVAFELAAGTPDVKEARALLAEPNGAIPPHS